jgi:NADH dehydrogenase
VWHKTPHVVVVGAGYAGLPCALRLAHRAQQGDKALCRVTLINPEPKQELSSELYRAFRNGDPAFLPFLQLCKNAGVDFLEARVNDIDPQNKTLHYRGTQSGELKYDFAIFANGLKRKLPGLAGLDEQIKQNDELLNPKIFFFRNNHQASALRLCLNRTGFGEKTFRKNERDYFLVILGAGASGLEIAGEIAALRGKNEKARVIVIDSRDNLLPDFSPMARKILKRELGRLQIESILGSPATKISSNEIFIENGQVVPWDTLVICTGAQVNSKIFGGFQQEANSPGIETRLNFETKKYPEHFAIGDIAHSHKNHHPLANKVYLPKTAQYAVQEGHFVADILLDYFKKGESYNAKAFDPTDLGYLLSLGPWSGLGRLGPAAINPLKKYFSPFIVGPVVDELKRLANLKYRAQIEWDARSPF